METENRIVIFWWGEVWNYYQWLRVSVSQGEKSLGKRVVVVVAQWCEGTRSP